MDLLTFVLVFIITNLIGYILLENFTKNRNIFKNQNIKFKKLIPLIGNRNFFDLLNGKCLAELIQDDYDRFPNERVFGMFEFSAPTLFIRDPTIIKQIAIKDFTHFQDHKSFEISSSDKSMEIMANVLFSMKGQKWREMRTSLTPLFTGSRMRAMFQLVDKCIQQMMEFLKEEHVKNGPKPYSTKTLFSKYTNDITATCAFGVECDSLRDPKNELYLLGQKIMQFHKPYIMIIAFVLRFFPKLINLLNIKFLSADLTKKLHDLIINSMEFRRKEEIVRPDMIQLLMKLRQGQHLNVQDDEKLDIEAEYKVLNSKGKRSWTDDEIIAQPLLFFIAGLDGTSTTMSLLAYELAINPEVQNKLVDEIDETHENLNGNPLTYEVLQKMKYMDMVISEVLRKWPPNIVVDRECVKNYSYEDEQGLKFTVEKGTMVIVPMYALHRDPNYFPNPEKFDPERFSNENKSETNMNAYLPFGIGPRSCIGNRFALMEIKALFFHLLLNFVIKPSEGIQLPLKLKKRVFTLIPEKEIELYFEPRDKFVVI